MKIDSLVRVSLWTTAPLNILVAAGIAFPSGWVGSTLHFPPASHDFYTLLAGSLVGLFGCAYAWAALQPVISRPLLLLGGGGKLTAAIVAGWLYRQGQLHEILAVLIAGDLLFVILWLYYLVRASVTGTGVINE